MTRARVLPFSAGRAPAARQSETQRRDAVSPFRHLMSRHELTPREILHRQRMLQQLALRRAAL